MNLFLNFFFAGVSGLRNKSLRLDLRDYDVETQTFRINIMLLESSILGPHDLRSVPAPLHGNRKNLLCFLFGVENAQSKDSRCMHFH